MARALCVLIVCAGVAVAPVTTKARELAAPVEKATPVTVTTVTRLPAIEVTTAKKVRHDWYAGVGFGLGAGNFQAGAGASGAVTGLLRIGGRLTDRIALGAIVLTSAGGTRTGVSGFTNLMAEALFFPLHKRGRGLGVAVGLGLSSAFLRSPDESGVLVERKTQTGGGFGLGLGYDFWLARRFNLGVWVRGDGSGGRYGVRGSGNLGLVLSWY